ncbi:hypothetical protein Pelo_9660 [Pelomyxa schiedti]|nr:hypothetical protein Pelo_9660 [Pelomyxa schiedti]
MTDTFHAEVRVGKTSYMIECRVGPTWFATLVRLREVISAASGVTPTHQKILCNSQIIKGGNQLRKCIASGSVLRFMVLPSPTEIALVDDEQVVSVEASMTTLTTRPKPRPGEYTVLDLPDLVFHFIFLLLNLSDIKNFSRVCRRFRVACSNDVAVWKPLYMYMYNLQQSPLYQERAKKQIAKHSMSWKKAVLSANIAQCNWRRGRCNVVELVPFEAQSLTYYPMELTLVSIHSNSIRLFDMEQFSVLRVLKGYTSPAHTACFANSIVVSGHHDGTLSLWNTGGITCSLPWGTCSPEYSGSLKCSEKHAVTFVHYEGNTIQANLSNSEYQLWSIESGSKVGSLSLPHPTTAFLPLSAASTLCAGNALQLIDFRDIIDPSIHPVVELRDPVTKLSLCPNYPDLVLGSDGAGRVFQWDMRTWRSVREIETTQTISDLAVDPTKILACTNTGCKLWGVEEHLAPMEPTETWEQSINRLMGVPSCAALDQDWLVLSSSVRLSVLDYGPKKRV